MRWCPALLSNRGCFSSSSACGYGAADDWHPGLEECAYHCCTRSNGAVFARSCAIGLSMMIYFGALAVFPVSEVVAGLFTAPIFWLLLTWVLPESVGKAPLWASAQGFVGLLIVLQPGAADQPRVVVPVTGAAYAVGALLTRRVCAQEHVLTLVFWFFGLMFVSSAVGLVLLRVVPACQQRRLPCVPGTRPQNRCSISIAPCRPWIAGWRRLVDAGLQGWVNARGGRVRIQLYDFCGGLGMAVVGTDPGPARAGWDGPDPGVGHRDSALRDCRCRQVFAGPQSALNNCQLRLIGSKNRVNPPDPRHNHVQKVALADQC